ncbi:MAG: hypothetical protein ABJ360_23210 [Roseobacter sp.]
MNRFGGLIALLVAVPCTAAFASQKNYEGTEAEALRCANTVALTAVVLAGSDRISDVEKEVMLGISFLMLESHVSGTWRQKKAALDVMRDRRDEEETLDDFEQIAQRCLRQFPIN